MDNALFNGCFVNGPFPPNTVSINKLWLPESRLTFKTI